MHGFYRPYTPEEGGITVPNATPGGDLPLGCYQLHTSARLEPAAGNNLAFGPPAPQILVAQAATTGSSPNGHELPAGLGYP
jgi:hypothetical protein